MISEKFRTLPVLLLCLCLHGLAQSVRPTNRISAPVDESSRITLTGNVHPMAQARFDQGPAPASQATGRISLVLQRSAAQQQALNGYLSDLQNPASPRYHKWLTPSQYGAQFGISDSDLATVESWLQSQGFRIDRAPQARNIIQFSGTLGQIQAAFHTSVHRFVVNGESHFANVSDPQIPAALAPVVAGVGPLNDLHPKPTVVRGPKAMYDSSRHAFQPQPSLTFPIGNSYTPFLFAVPADVATIYDTPNASLNANFAGGTTYDGTGVNIGIVGISGLPMADVQNYRTGFLGETSTTVKLPTQVIDGNDPGLVPGAATEAILDNEIAGALAPGAKIYYYTAANTDLSDGLFDAISRAINDNSISILSISFGACEAAQGTGGNALILEVAEQAAAQGISIVVSAGDGGSAGCDNFDTATAAQYGFAVNSFASTPHTIAVGGTDFDALSQSFTSYVTSGGQSAAGSPPYYRTALKYIPENPWNDSTTVNGSLSQNVAYKDSQGSTNIVAGGGGASSIYSKPSFQTSLTPNDNHRDVPDVSLLAGNGFYQALWLLCSDSISDGSSTQYTDCQNTNGTFQNGTYFSGVGGTSASAPAFAGMLALVSQAQGGARLGQANYVLYQLARSRPSVFHDVTIGNNSVPCVSGSPNCGANLFLTGYDAASGYDTASGLGSVDVTAMINAWNAVSLTSTSATLQINGSTAAYTGVHGASLTFSVGVTGSGGTPTGVVAIADDANLTGGGTASGPQNNGQFAIPLTAGSGSTTYNGLPGGSYQVTARYGGDDSFAASTSTPISVSISAEPSTTALTINAYDPSTGNSISNSNVPYGYYVVADAAIKGTAEGSNTQGVAAGSVQFLNGSTVLGMSAVSSGNQASWPPLNSTFSALPAGSYNLTAKYSGDASYSASSATATFTIAKAATTTTAGYAGSPVEYGNSEQIAADVLTSSYGAAPTGTFQFYVDGQAALAPQSIYESGAYNNSNGKNNWAWADAQTSYAFLTAGQHTLSASYSGDVNYAASTSPTTTVMVTQARSEVAGWGFANTQTNPVVVGQSATGTATVFGSQYGVPPTGTITFYDGAAALTDPVTYTSSHNPLSLSQLQATTQHVFSTAGMHQITVRYSGDTNYTSSTSAGAQFLNVLGPFSLAAGGVMTISAPGQSGSVLINVTANTGFTGTVTLSCAAPLTAQETTCGFGSGGNITPTAQVTITGPAATVNLNVTTTAQHQSSASLPGWRSGGMFLAVVFVVIAPRRGWNRRMGLLMLSMGLIFCQTGCGGGGASGGGGGTTNSGTLPGTYVFTVTGTSGSGASAISTSTQVTVVVQ
ncbi:MAG TPA: Ig-like domain repeat protein [Acidobacteriaceae bacterium]|nr:Ig-like domain repeat protein [Acidobacteriaceae bacterium]